MTSSSGKRIKTIESKRKDKEPKRFYSNKFLSRKHERHFNIVQDRSLLRERKVGLILDFAPQFGEQSENRNWERLATYPAPANIAVVKEFYTNARRLGDYPTEDTPFGQVATSKMIIGMYDTPPGRRWTVDEFNNVVAWQEEQAHASGAGAAEASAMDDDEDHDDDFEDAEEEGEEEDSDDSRG
ncbi:hypothetical protein LR48_Vigan05g083000 [Vigna angularis]|uniref:Uncharacterized protein n=1 Tax=Phaseolus angularis TaxID=3914 RepID=A0A0L9UKK7_PHAAN|nr:hypothetical protein LR48_Vigan05g083000 [Vigna angularis]